MDNFLLQAIVAEMEPLLVGHRFEKMSQLGSTGFMIDLRLRDGRWLAISTDPQTLALYLTARSPKQLGEPHRSDTAFVSLVKKHLGHARLVSVNKLGYDRVVKFEFIADGENAQKRPLSLVVMLTGRGANVLLVDQSQVIASLRERDESITTFLDPAPPEDKLDPFLLSAEKLDELISSGNGDIAEAAQKHLIGFTPVYSRELASRAVHSAPFEALQNLTTSLVESPPSPVIYSSFPLDLLKHEIGREDYRQLVSAIELEHLTGQDKTVYPTVNEAADAYFTIQNERRRFFALKQKTDSHLSSMLKKNRALIANLQRERQGFANIEKHQRYGELLLANLHQAVETETGFIVTDFYDEAQSTIEIPGANKASPQAAAEHYFKLARKARHGMEKIEARLPEVEREVDRLEAQRSRLESIVRSEELDAFAEQSGLQPAQPGRDKIGSQTQRKRKEEKISGVRRYRSSDGYEILVGRTDRDNDNLTFRIAKSYDLWFHAADYPGSHVVARNPTRKEIPPRVITEAAQLAAKFSQAGGGAKVAVNYCERKFVTKMKGFAPGQVRLSSFKTVLVEPGEAGERVL